MLAEVLPYLPTFFYFLTFLFLVINIYTMSQDRSIVQSSSSAKSYYPMDICVLLFLAIAMIAERGFRLGRY